MTFLLARVNIEARNYRSVIGGTGGIRTGPVTDRQKIARLC